MSLTLEGAVHFPANADKFEFDAQVTAIFPNMAVRSIPNYILAHDMHAAIAVSHLKDGHHVLDIGASHGEFYHALYRAYTSRGLQVPDITLTATDVSHDMCAIIRAAFTYVRVMQQDLMENPFLQWREKFDFINCMYVLQFLPEFAQPLVLTKMCTMLRPGGILSIGQKESLSGPIGDMLHEEYIRFRMANGYTKAEIDAKTHALRNSMWPMSRDRLYELLSTESLHMDRVTPITRAGVFATYICRRQDNVPCQ